MNILYKLILSNIFIFFYCVSSFAQTVIQMKKESGVFIVPCIVNGLKLKFIFDTGASKVTVSLTEAIFMIKNGYIAEDDIVGTSYAQLANGQITENTSIILKDIEIGGMHLYNVGASVVHELDAPLLLGQSAISRLGKIQLDYANSTLTIIDGTKKLDSDNIVSKYPSVDSTKKLANADLSKKHASDYSTKKSEIDTKYLIEKYKKDSKDSTDYSYDAGKYKYATSLDPNIFIGILRSEYEWIDGKFVGGDSIYTIPKDAIIYVIDDKCCNYKVEVNGYIGRIINTNLRRWK